jgi:uncharacterized membrane protein YccC
MKIPRLVISDPELASLKSAARAAIVMPAVFALGDKVIAQPQVALFGAFGSFAMLVLASFGGPPRSRLTAYLSLAVAGVVLVTLGTACSRNAWLAAGAMAVVGFAILFSGVINGYFAAGGTAAVLVFVLSVSVPAPASDIPYRLAGWGLAATAGILAVMFLWPPHDRATLRPDAAQSCLALASLAEALCAARPAEEARLQAAQKSTADLVKRLHGVPHRPTGPIRSTAALGGVIDELGWLSQSMTYLAKSPPGELCMDENSATLQAVAAVLRASAAELSGRPELSTTGPDGQQPVERLEVARETAAQQLARRISALPEVPDEESLQAMVDRGFRVHAISYTTRQIAAYARVASPQGGPPLAGVPRLDELTATPGPAIVGRPARAAVEAPAAEDPLTGHALGQRPWHRFLPSWLVGADDFAFTHADYRSVWFRNSVRGAVGLAIAVFIAQKTDLQHSFWVVLGTLSVLRSNALGTGWSVLSALAGTAVGILIGAAILIPVAGHDTVLWAVLPVAVLLGAYAPRVISFAAGQAAFTVVVLVLFNIIQPAGWKVGIIRIEDVAVGFAISLGVGLVFWPRGAAALLRQNLAAAYSRTADYVAAMIEQLSGVGGGADPGRAGAAAAAAMHRLDDSLREYLSERSAQRSDPERVSRLVGGAAKVLRTGQSLAALDLVAAGPGAAASQPGHPQLDRQPGHRIPLTLSTADPPATSSPAGQRKPCAERLDQDVLKLRAWYVTLGDSIVNRTSLPPPEQPEQVARSGMLQCTRQAISSGQPTVARNALLMLWASEHLDMLWRLEAHLGRAQETGEAAAARPAEAAAAASPQ